VKCQFCQQADATVHVKQAVNGSARELHLCEACAARNGLDVHSPLNITDFLFGLEVEKASPRATGERKCGGCGTTRSDYQKSTRLGCPTCYRTFADDVTPLIADAHKGPRHAGKVPRKEEKKIELQALEVGLKRAIETEDFEQAAHLRDRIRDLRAADAGSVSP